MQCAKGGAEDMGEDQLVWARGKLSQTGAFHRIIASLEELSLRPLAY
jgi:hypothetical protein